MYPLTYFIDNKLGGVSSLNLNLIKRAPSEASQTVIHIEQQEWSMSRAQINYPVDQQIYFHYTEQENYYQSLKRLHDGLPDQDGALILNYEMEMAMLDHYPTRYTTYQLVHDDYNVGLAKKYGYLSDVFICHNSIIFEKLMANMPERKSSIFYLPHGVQIPSFHTIIDTETKAPLRLFFLGRMTVSKGIFDLPVIDSLLREKGVEVIWTCVGNGPDLEMLKAKWGDRATFVSPATNEEVMRIAAAQDVFVLPTKFEGSPVSLLETMSVGLVPVVSKIPGGITDIVKSDIGFTVEVDNHFQFAESIIALNGNRDLLKTLSENCRKEIIEKYNLEKTALSYHDLFTRYREFYREKKIRRTKVGARLDHPLIPDWFTRWVRGRRTVK